MKYYGDTHVYLDYLYSVSFLLPIEASYKISLDWPSGFKGEDL